MNPPRDDLRVFSYLTAERSDIYRKIMNTFMEEQSRFALHLRSDEALRLILQNHPYLESLEKSSLEPLLDQLCEWGNLERHQDTSDVRTVKEFYERHYLYQLTRGGEEAERAIARYLSAIVEAGELKAAALVDIQRHLNELVLLLENSTLDAGKVFETLSQLRIRFDELTTRAQTFMSSLQRSIDFREEDMELGLLKYKEILIGYLQKFILELRTSTHAIASLIQKLESLSLDTMWKTVAIREHADSLEGQTSIDKTIQEWRLRWHGLRSWFLGDSQSPPRSEVLRKKALSAIPLLLSAIHRLNERRVSRTDRAADLRVLAQWFAETDTDADAHRLWMAAFGLTPSRHLMVDSQTVVEREGKPVRPQTSWMDACSVKISPRLRSTSRYTRRGPGTSVIDRSSEKAFLESLAKAEVKQIEEARTELISKKEIRLSEINSLSESGFDLFLDVLGDALARKVEMHAEIDATSSDGSLMIHLRPTLDDTVATIETRFGIFSGPDHFIEVREMNG